MILGTGTGSLFHISYFRFASIVNLFSVHAVALGTKVVVSIGVIVASFALLDATVVLAEEDMMVIDAAQLLS